MIANRFNPLGIRASTPAMRYVQDGLIAHWDGEENVGYGMHDSSSPIWKDLVGLFGVDFNILTASWDSNHLRCDNEERILAPRTKAFFDATKEGYTLELVLKTPNAFNGAPFGLGHSSQILFAQYSDVLIFSRASNGYGGVGTSLDQGASYVRPSTIGADTWNGQKFSFTLTGDIVNQKTRQYVNGQLHKEYPVGGMIGTSLSQANYIGINNNGFAGNSTYGGIVSSGGLYFNAKIYGRAITKEEVAYHYEINKERFGI